MRECCECEPHVFLTAPKTPGEVETARYSFKELANQIVKEGTDWRNAHDEVIQLARIFKPKPNSSFENEQVFAHNKNVVTAKRDRGDDQVESLVKMGHDSSRRFGDTRYKIVDLIPYYDTDVRVSNKQAAERMRKLRGERKKDANPRPQKKAKNFAQHTLKETLSSKSSSSKSVSNSSSRSTGRAAGQPILRMFSASPTREISHWH